MGWAVCHFSSLALCSICSRRGQQSLPCDLPVQRLPPYRGLKGCHIWSSMFSLHAQHGADTDLSKAVAASTLVCSRDVLYREQFQLSASSTQELPANLQHEANGFVRKRSDWLREQAWESEGKPGHLMINTSFFFLQNYSQLHQYCI